MRLSSTCHWCHVMERESFENQEVADMLNEHFVSIKVDREERPDIDNLYMAVCQTLTGHGGWPLTVLLTPDQRPFYAGTYFPRRSMLGRVGLLDLLEQIKDRWASDREGLVELSDELMAEVQERTLSSLPGQVDEQLLHNAYQHYEKLFDPAYGGFGSAPKFPTPHNLCYLLAYAKAYDQPKAQEMVVRTLDGMYRGGLYDHIGFGFARYSTDEKWLVPHFEKMLYDNALLAIAYLEAFQAAGERKYAAIAESVFHYVLRDMTSPEGAFYSAEDADSEGVEGKFYVFTRDEIEEALGLEDMHTYCHVYDITPEGNFEGSNIPNLIRQSLEQIAEERGIRLLALESRLEECRERLYKYREQRVHPSKDDKILTAWNGLMIAAMARGAKVLQKPQYAEAAERAAEFIWTSLRREDGRLLARYRDGEAAYEAYLDDYAYLLWGCLELFEATNKPHYLQRAISLKDDMFNLFWEDEEGGFYFSGHDGEKLLTGSKEIYDGALPSGNSVAALQLYKLAALTQDAELQNLSVRHLQAFGGTVRRYPTGFAMYLQAALQQVKGGQEIVLSGKPDDPVLHEMIAAVQRSYSPGSVLVVNYLGPDGEPLRQLLPHLGDKAAINGLATAYICENFACQAPITTLEALKEELKNS
ncbi:Glycosyl hydrolase family 9 [compost metagenome]